MANYANLLATIAANIYTNNNNEVSAAMVKTAVDQMVASLGAGYQFIDIATPATNPGTPDYKCFYLAFEPGTYTNFGGKIITSKGCIFTYDGAWAASDLDLPSLEDLEDVYKEIFDDWQAYGINLISGKLIGEDGSIVDTSSDSSISEKIFVNPGDFLRIAASSWYGYAFYAFYDADGNLLSSKLSQPDGTIYYFDGIVKVPSGANYLIVATTFSYAPSVHIEKPKYITTSESQSPQTINSTSGQLLGRSDDPGTLVPSGARYWLSEAVAVTPGNYYRVHASSEWAYGLYAFYDTDGNFITGEWAEGSAATTTIDKVVFAPSNSATLRIANVEPVPTPILWDIAISEKIKADSFMPYGGKKWAAMGDSLTEVNSRTSIHYHDYVAEVTGITVVNLGISGSGYAAGSAFYNRINTIPMDSDVVTIFGSFNDLSSGLPLGEVSDSGTTTICGCINKTLDDLFAAIPLVNLGIVTPTPWNSATPSMSSASDYVDAIVEICKIRSIPCLDLFHCSNLRPWDAAFRQLAYSNDGGNGVHPDENGHKLIAPRFEEFIKSLLLN